ncbi:unnamed protein product, partial [Urochloa humidicola]
GSPLPPFVLLVSGNFQDSLRRGGIQGISRQVTREERLPEDEEMITRAKLVEQLREHQIRSAQSYSAALAVFSPSPHIASRRDLKVALIYAVLFCFLMVSCYVALYLKWFKLSAMFVIFGILLPVSLKISRHRRLKRKRERRLLLPLSM